MSDWWRHRHRRGPATARRTVRATSRRRVWAGFALLLLCAVNTAPAPAEAVDLALVLAVDASGSVDQHRFELQRQGYAAAFRSPRVINAIRSGGAQAIAVAMVQWTGPALQNQVIGWTLVRDAASAEDFAAIIERTPRQLYGGGTSISGAIDFSRLLLMQLPFTASRRVIDVSGDGSNNRGRDVTLARDEAVRDGIAINGLPILALEPDLDRYYYDRVIGGPGAFMIPAASYETFADAVLKKLVMEIAADERGRGFPLPSPHAARLHGRDSPFAPISRRPTYRPSTGAVPSCLKTCAPPPKAWLRRCLILPPDRPSGLPSPVFPAPARRCSSPA